MTIAVKLPGGGAPVNAHTVAFRPATAMNCQAAPMRNTELSNAANAIDAILGRLETHDEAILREPLSAMCVAGARFQSAHDSGDERQVSLSAAIFATRLNDVRLPDRTRTALAAHLAAYEHDLLSGDDAIFAASRSGLAGR